MSYWASRWTASKSTPGDQFPKATVIDLIAGEGDQPLLAEDTLSIEDF